MAFYRSISIYISDRPGAGVGATVGMQEVAKVRLEIPLLLVKTFLASLSLLKKAGLRQVYDLAIELARPVLKVFIKNLFF